MMTNSELIIAYVNHEYGGAYKALQIAKRKGKKIINIFELVWHKNERVAPLGVTLLFLSAFQNLVGFENGNLGFAVGDFAIHHHFIKLVDVDIFHV